MLRMTFTSHRAASPSESATSEYQDLTEKLNRANANYTTLGSLQTQQQQRSQQTELQRQLAVTAGGEPIRSAIIAVVHLSAVADLDDTTTSVASGFQQNDATALEH